MLFNQFFLLDILPFNPIDALLIFSKYQVGPVLNFLPIIQMFLNFISRRPWFDLYCLVFINLLDLLCKSAKLATPIGALRVCLVTRFSLHVFQGEGRVKGKILVENFQLEVTRSCKSILSFLSRGFKCSIQSALPEFKFYGASTVMDNYILTSVFPQFQNAYQ